MQKLFFAQVPQQKAKDPSWNVILFWKDDGHQVEWSQVHPGADAAKHFPPSSLTLGQIIQLVTDIVEN